MKILYYGGQKSGKSHLAEQHAITLAQGRTPYYIATYDNHYGDEEMVQRITQHQHQRKQRFHTLEEPHTLSPLLKPNACYLIDCISMLILNRLDEPIESLLQEITHLTQSQSDIVFVLNDVSGGIIPMEASTRRFVDYSGIIGQHLAQQCDSVYHVTLGIPSQLK